MPKSVLTPKRSLIARIAILAVVASFLVVAAVPASAHSVAISTAVSCPAATPSAGFTDIGAFSAEIQLAINCLANFDITQGTSATTYSPNNVVLRWQMALFLVRQAAVHGVTVPAAASQGYTDVAGLPQATIDAINQVTQLGISKGTSSTTFSPNEPVTRWQMALFLRRLAAAAGVTVTDDPAHNQFTDIGAYTAEIQAAINFLADAHIALGTGGSLYSGNEVVTRWQMALFLTRVLAADGILPPAGLLVTVTPTDAATLGSGTARAYTATFKNANGTPYTGLVKIHILDVNASDVAIQGDFAENVRFEALSDSVAGNGTMAAIGFPGTDGIITFLIRHDGVAAEKVRPYAFQDPNNNSVVDAGEGAGAGGLATFSGVPVTEAVAGAHADATVVSVNAAADSFVGDDPAHAPETFFYDSNDIFVNGGPVDLAAFEAALNAGDIIDVTSYATDAAGQSTFVFDTDNDVGLTITDPAAPVTVDAGTYAVKGTGSPGMFVVIYFDDNNNGAIDGLDAIIGGPVEIAADGTWTVNVPLVQNTTNPMIATQRATAGGANGTLVDVPTVTESAAAAASLEVPVTSTNGGLVGILDAGDTLTLNFNEAMNLTFTGDSLQVTDGTDTVTLTQGVNASFAQGADTSIIVVTLTAAPGATVNQPAAIQNLVGFVGADGLTVNINTDPDRAIVAGF